jgi:hypothetical protein
VKKKKKYIKINISIEYEPTREGYVEARGVLQRFVKAFDLAIKNQIWNKKPKP